MVKAVIFTDFDGTVTWQDSNDYLTDTYGFGKETRGKIFEGVLDGSKSFRDGFTAMIDSINKPLPECMKALEEKIQLDPGFKDTFEWAQANDVPIIVVSSGMKTIIKDLLTRLLGAESVTKLTIEANEVEVGSDDQWKVIFKDETPFGHDKSRTIAAYREKYEAHLKEGEQRPTSVSYTHLDVYKRQQ